MVKRKNKNKGSNILEALLHEIEKAGLSEEDVRALVEMSRGTKSKKKKARRKNPKVSGEGLRGFIFDQHDLAMQNSPYFGKDRVLKPMAETFAYWQGVIRDKSIQNIPEIYKKLNEIESGTIYDLDVLPASADPMTSKESGPRTRLLKVRRDYSMGRPRLMIQTGSKKETGAPKTSLLYQQGIGLPTDPFRVGVDRLGNWEPQFNQGLVQYYRGELDKLERREILRGVGLKRKQVPPSLSDVENQETAAVRDALARGDTASLTRMLYNFQAYRTPHRDMLIDYINRYYPNLDVVVRTRNPRRRKKNPEIRDENPWLRGDQLLSVYQDAEQKTQQPEFITKTNERFAQNIHPQQTYNVDVKELNPYAVSIMSNEDTSSVHHSMPLSFNKNSLYNQTAGWKVLREAEDRAEESVQHLRWLHAASLADPQMSPYQRNYIAEQLQLREQQRDLIRLRRQRETQAELQRKLEAMAANPPDNSEALQRYQQELDDGLFGGRNNNPPSEYAELHRISMSTGLPLNVLTKVYKRGIKEWMGSAKIRRMSPRRQIWAMSRVHSFVKGGRHRQEKDMDLAQVAFPR